VNRTIAPIAAALVAWRRRGHLKDPLELMSLFGLVLLIRPLTETINFSYYWSPGLLMLALAGAIGRPRLSVAFWVWPVIAMAWALPHSGGLPNLDWWVGELLILALAGWTLAPIGGYRRAALSLPVGAQRHEPMEAAR
jgi:hypothetical protein